ncbi:hypothetical protein ACP70R_003249 [Stipagrostis hirtigluma subsp. patula]
MARLPLLAAALALLAAASASAASSWFHEQFVTDGTVRLDHDASGQPVTQLILDRQSGGGFASRQKYMYGEFSIHLKLVRGDSAGTVTSFYLSSDDGPGHDEIDMEFMGNVSGDPVALNTNVWAQGDGRKEHQFYLWFDPAADFHKYTILWNHKNIIFSVDDVVVRCFRRRPDLPYPGGKPMAVHASLWDGSVWATRQGTVKINWASAPFVVSYRGYSVDACTAPHGVGHGRPLNCPAGTDRWMEKEPSAAEWRSVAWAREKYMHYDYCKDWWRFNHSFPPECFRH